MSATTTATTTNTDLHIVKTELFDADVMDCLLRMTDKFSVKDLRSLSRYKKGRKFGNQVEVVYHYGEGCEADRLGRLYVKDEQGLQAFPSDIRNPLLEKHYWDIDMENAHYNIMAQFLEWNQIPHKNINFYCENRDASLKKVSANRTTAKTAFLKVAYGGNIKHLDDGYNEDGITPEGDTSLLMEIEKEIKVLIAWLKVQPRFKRHFEIATERCRKHNVNSKAKKEKNPKWIPKNPDFSGLALVLQSEECKILQVMIEYFQGQGRSVDILIHDGCEIRKLDGEPFFPENLLRGCEKDVKTKTGYSIKLINKPIKHNFVMPERKDQPLVDDEYAGRYFVSLMGNHIAREGEDVYFFNEDTGMWEKTETAFRCAVSKHKQRLIFPIKEDDVRNYGGVEKNVMNMRKWINPALPDGTFISDHIDRAYGKLLFKNGIYDFPTDTFTEGFDPEIVFQKRINRNFPTHRDESLIKTTHDTLFVNGFDDEDGKLAGQFLKEGLCIGLIGDYRRKKFYFGLGEADCGKGVLKDAFTNAFEGYVCEWNPNCLKYNPRNGQDEAKALAWVNDIAGARLAFGNEMRLDGKALDGNLLKSLSSGGDGIQIRTNHKDQWKVINRATMFLMANDMCPIEPKDSGASTRCRFIRYKLHFVENPTASDERLKDGKLYEKVATQEWRDALFFVMVDTYKAMTEAERKLNGELKTPNCVKEETAEWIGDGGLSQFRDRILLRYRITGDAEDSVSSSEIVEWVNDGGIRISANKIGRMLTKLIQNENALCPRDRNPMGEEVGKQRLGLVKKDVSPYWRRHP